jgi:hypothetical protein
MWGEHAGGQHPCVVAEPALRNGGGVRWLLGDAAPSAPLGSSQQLARDCAADADGAPTGRLPIEEATTRAHAQSRDQAATPDPGHRASDPTDPEMHSAPPDGAGQERVGSVPLDALPALDTIDELHHLLGSAFREGAAGGEGASPDRGDVDMVVEAAVAVCAAAGGDVVGMARRAGEVVAAMEELGLPEAARRPVDWSGFGVLIPVLSGSPGAGASVLAVALTDALQRAGRCALLVDAADPARSGLATAAATEGPWAHSPHRDLTIRYSWREHAVLARLATTLPVLTPGMLPPPPAWLPQLDPLHATVVDIGHDGWRAAADPLVGAGGWLRHGTPAPRPLLVVRPTRPSLQLAERVLARLDPWIAAGIAAAPWAMVVVGAKRWPAGVAGAAGQRVARLVDTAVFLPHDLQVAVGGVTDALLPDRLLDAVSPLLAQWGLIPPIRSRKGHR